MMKNHILAATNKDGRTVFIDDVPNGKDCGCVCKECGGTLIAKNNGSIKAHHFAHKSGNDSIKCSQTALHLLAKEIIAEEKRIPAFADGGIKFVEADFVEQEKNLGDIIPDVYAEHSGKPVAVEIFVSHAVDDEKIAKIQNHRLTTFEINLSELIFETKEDVRQAIYDIKNIRPVYDEQFTEKALADKKQFIDTNGMIKAVHNGIVSECPMHLELRGTQGIFSSIDSSLCQKCPFGYKKEDETVVHCTGHLSIETSKAIFLSRLYHQSITVTLDYNCQINVSENKVVPLAELADFLTCVTKQKFTVIRQRKRKPAEHISSPGHSAKPSARNLSLSTRNFLRKTFPARQSMLSWKRMQKICNERIPMQASGFVRSPEGLQSGFIPFMRPKGRGMNPSARIKTLCVLSDFARAENSSERLKLTAGLYAGLWLAIQVFCFIFLQKTRAVNFNSSLQSKLVY